MVAEAEHVDSEPLSHAVGALGRLQSSCRTVGLHCHCFGTNRSTNDFGKSQGTPTQPSSHALKQRRRNSLLFFVPGSRTSNNAPLATLGKTELLVFSSEIKRILSSSVLFLEGLPLHVVYAHDNQPTAKTFRGLVIS